MNGTNSNGSHHTYIKEQGESFRDFNPEQWFLVSLLKNGKIHNISLGKSQVTGEATQTRQKQAVGVSGGWTLKN
jgi:hypothetical protein